MTILAPNLDLGLLEASGNYNLAVKEQFLGSKSGPGPFEAFWQLQFGCEMAILASNLDLGLVVPSGNYNLAVKWAFWLQIWTWAIWSFLAITIWLWNGHFGLKSGPGPFGSFWQLQFGCEMAILASNLDPGLWSFLAITIWLWNSDFGTEPGPGPFGAFWQLQFGCEMAILVRNLDLGLLEASGNYNLAVKWPAEVFAVAGLQGVCGQGVQNSNSKMGLCSLVGRSGAKPTQVFQGRKGRPGANPMQVFRGRKGRPGTNPMQIFQGCKCRPGTNYVQVFQGLLAPDLDLGLLQPPSNFFG